MLIFLIGLGILVYPKFSDFYYRIEANNQVADFDQVRSELDQAEIDERMRLARAYNDSWANVITEDPYTAEEREEGIKAYARMLELREKIATVQIPAINTNLPVYAGTGEDILQKGAGHLEGTSLPIGGTSTHSVITAHSGLPSKKLFTDLHDLKIGDKFYIHNIEGVLAYQVDQILTIDPTNFSDLLIVPGHDYVTLLTCTPIGINSHRLIVRGHQVPYVEAVEERIIADNEASFRYQTYFYIALGLIALLLLLLFATARKKRELQKRLKEKRLAEKALLAEQEKKKVLEDPEETKNKETGP